MAGRWLSQKPNPVVTSEEEPIYAGIASFLAMTERDF
jgi:hypothetical protein